MPALGQEFNVWAWKPNHCFTGAQYCYPSGQFDNNPMRWLISLLPVLFYFILSVGMCYNYEQTEEIDFSFNLDLNATQAKKEKKILCL